MPKDSNKNLSLEEILEINRMIYQIPDDRLYSIEDILYNHQKFITNFAEEKNRGDLKQGRLNLMIALAWYFALMNRYHIDLESLLWKRYSYKCPFCLDIPCICKEGKKSATQKTGRPSSRKPGNISKWQAMVQKIYPDEIIDHSYIKLHLVFDRIDASLRLFMREKKKKQFHDIEIYSTDYFVMLLRIFNYYKCDIEAEHHKMFSRGCYVCHEVPCQCNYFE
jgi:hypothetical protein